MIPLGRLGPRYEYNIKLDLKEMGCGRWIQLGYECVTSSAIAELNSDSTAVGIRSLTGAFGF